MSILWVVGRSTREPEEGKGTCFRSLLICPGLTQGGVLRGTHHRDAIEDELNLLLVLFSSLPEAHFDTGNDDVDFDGDGGHGFAFQRDEKSWQGQLDSVIPKVLAVFASGGAGAPGYAGRENGPDRGSEKALHGPVKTGEHGVSPLSYHHIMFCFVPLISLPVVALFAPRRLRYFLGHGAVGGGAGRQRGQQPPRWPERTPNVSSRRPLRGRTAVFLAERSYFKLKLAFSRLRLSSG